ncbi:hypothetical protein NA56DRAFT_689545 [Hyaloscypha hepaticicola]|uniref:Uncharacterized protein n=1 Tax=Hyaloscypha hepaticicola TaxID=2082293 RepID=A0A2J6Q2J5_9HELO|nr:hypothetical protein NA56DRAFT_689545 [Hyaloscypha hepaticicola]
MPSLLVPDRDNLKRPGFEGANWQGIENGTFSVFSSDHCPLIYEEHEGAWQTDSIQQPVAVSLSDLELGEVYQTFNAWKGISLVFIESSNRERSPSRLPVITSQTGLTTSWLAQLPSEHLDLLTNPAAHYNVGWSHGKEGLKPGQHDTMKGSYYATSMSSYLQAAPENAQEQPTFE